MAQPGDLLQYTPVALWRKQVALRLGVTTLVNTSATTGFMFVPTVFGTPTGTPEGVVGMGPIVINASANKLMFYSGGAWRDAGP